MESLSLIIPVHNAEGFIKNSLKEYHKTLSRAFKKFEMIVVCNACKDHTLDICNSLKSKLPLKVINVPERGKGNAIVKGFAYAENEIIGFLDADNPFDLSEVLKMIDLLNYKDVIIATKFKKGNLKNQPSLSRRFFSIVGSIITRIFFDLKFQDTQAGAKFMRRYVWDKIGKNFICKGFEFDIEFLYRTNKKGFLISEYFIQPRKSDYSTVKLRILPGMLKRLFILRLLK